MKLWNGEDLKGLWKFSVKIDGVNATWDGEKFVSRSNKPLYNVNQLALFLQPEVGEVYEVFCGSFKRSNSLTRRSRDSSELVTQFEMFDLEPHLDPRLGLFEMNNPCAEDIQITFEAILEQGYEGLVLRGPNGERLKVKDKLTFDVIVTGITEGKGKNVGKVGAMITSKGKVSSGLSDKQREEFYDGSIIGQMIEAECMEVTEKGKMRHARFLRIRDDKPMEEADG